VFVEGERQILEAAEIVAKPGAKLLRGGKRLNAHLAYEFPGLEFGRAEDGWIRRVAHRARNHHRSDERSRRGSGGRVRDILQIGARKCKFRIAENAGKCGTAILLKRGMSSTVRELLMSAGICRGAWQRTVMLCERGIPHLRNDHAQYLRPGVMPG